MKKWITLSLIALSTTSASFAAPSKAIFEAKASYHFDHEESYDPQIINVYDVTNRELNQAMKGNYTNLVVKFPKGAVLPIHFYLKGDLLSLIEINGKESSGKVKVMQTFYARFDQEKLLLSSDLVKWTPFLDFITGQIDACLSIQEDGEPSVRFGAETNRRF